MQAQRKHKVTQTTATSIYSEYPLTRRCKSLCLIRNIGRIVHNLLAIAPITVTSVSAVRGPAISISLQIPYKEPGWQSNLQQRATLMDDILLHVSFNKPHLFSLPQRRFISLQLVTLACMLHAAGPPQACQYKQTYKGIFNKNLRGPF